MGRPCQYWFPCHKLLGHWVHCWPSGIKCHCHSNLGPPCRALLSNGTLHRIQHGFVLQINTPTHFFSGLATNIKILSTQSMFEVPTLGPSIPTNRPWQISALAWPPTHGGAATNPGGAAHLLSFTTAVTSQCKTPCQACLKTNLAKVQQHRAMSLAMAPQQLKIQWGSAKRWSSWSNILLRQVDRSDLCAIPVWTRSAHDLSKQRILKTEDLSMQNFGRNYTLGATIMGIYIVYQMSMIWGFHACAIAIQKRYALPVLCLGLHAFALKLHCDIKRFQAPWHDAIKPCPCFWNILHTLTRPDAVLTINRCMVNFVWHFFADTSENQALPVNFRFW